MSRPLTLGAAHVAPVFLDPQATAAKGADWIRRARDEGVGVLVFPEVFLPGFPYWINCYPPLLQAPLNRRYQDLSVAVDGPEIAVLAEAARATGVAVVVGVSERPEGQRTCFNSVVFIAGDGRVAGVHRKLKPTYAERYIWGEGDGSGLVVPLLAGTRVGALACWEHTMNLARQALIDQQAEVHAALWPGLSTMAGFEAVANLQIEAMMKNHALTGQCFVACSASPVTPEMLDLMARELGPQQLLAPGGGWTAVLHPFGPVLAGPVSGPAETLVSARVDLDDRNDVKMWLDTTGHYARPDVLQLRVDRRPRTTAVFRDDEADIP